MALYKFRIIIIIIIPDAGRKHFIRLILLNMSQIDFWTVQP